MYKTRCITCSVNSPESRACIKITINNYNYANKTHWSLLISPKQYYKSQHCKQDIKRAEHGRGGGQTGGFSRVNQFNMKVKWKSWQQSCYGLFQFVRSGISRIPKHQWH